MTASAEHKGQGILTRLEGKVTKQNKCLDNQPLATLEWPQGHTITVISVGLPISLITIA